MALLFGTSARRVALRSSPLDTWTSLTSSLPSTSSVQLQRLPSLAPAATPSTSRSIHKVSVRKTKQPVSKQQRRASAKKKAVNLEKKALRGQLARETQPDPVLGYRPGNTREKGVNDEGLWQNCELKKIILSKRDVWGLSNDNRGNLVNESSEASRGTAEERAEREEYGGPLRLNFGFTKEDRELLFKDLPEVTTEDRIKMHLNERMGGAGAAAFNPTADEPAMAQLSRDFEEMQQQEMKSSDMLSRVLDLRNASAKGIDVENKRRIVEHFGGGKDTGSVETQVAILTYRLHLLHEHLSQPGFRKDEVTRRSSSMLVHKRIRLLKYLRRQSESRYHALLKRVGVNPRAVEGEIVVPGRPKLVTT